ncbi:MAG: hypothetical protein MRY21_03670 [Simkaniaceae bacterium]|nr:hypothetical protein [Simkaniaceae bacterium]
MTPPVMQAGYIPLLGGSEKRAKWHHRMVKVITWLPKKSWQHIIKPIFKWIANAFSCCKCCRSKFPHAAILLKKEARMFVDSIEHTENSADELMYLYQLYQMHPKVVKLSDLKFTLANFQILIESGFDKLTRTSKDLLRNTSPLPDARVELFDVSKREAACSRIFNALVTFPLNRSHYATKCSLEQAKSIIRAEVEAFKEDVQRDISLRDAASCRFEQTAKLIREHRNVIFQELWAGGVIPPIKTLQDADALLAAL